MSSPPSFPRLLASPQWDHPFASIHARKACSRSLDLPQYTTTTQRTHEGSACHYLCIYLSSPTTHTHTPTLSESPYTLPLFFTKAAPAAPGRGGEGRARRWTTSRTESSSLLIEIRRKGRGSEQVLSWVEGRLACTRISLCTSTTRDERRASMRDETRREEIRRDTYLCVLRAVWCVVWYVWCDVCAIIACC